MAIVTNPTAGDVHVNRPLTNFAQKYMQNMDAFVGMNAFPNLPVTKQSDLYYEYDRDDWYRDDAEERADGTESSGGSFTLSTNPYFARVWAHHKDVTDRQRANQDEPIRLDQSATQYVTHKLMIRRERLFVQNLFSAAAWDSYTDPGVNWTSATSDPIINIRNAIRIVQQNTGYRPNKILMGRQAYDTLLDNDMILARITGGSTTAMPAMVMRELLAQLFEVERIMVMDSIFTDKIAGETVTQSDRQFIGGDNVLVYYAPDSVGPEEPTAGVQFSWTGLMGNTPNGMRIRRFRMEELEADRVEGQMAFDYRKTSADLGFFFGDVSS